MKILILRFSSIGDIVLTTPVIRCLKKQLKGVKIHYLTKKSFKSVVEYNPYIDKLFLFDKDLSEIQGNLEDEKYDLVIDLHKNLRSQKLRRSLKCKSIAFNKINIAKWLIVNFKIDYLPQKHIVDRYFDAMIDLEIVYDGKGLDFFINPENEINSQQAFPGLSEKYACVVIGAAHKTKQIPTQKIIDWINQSKMQVVLLGGPDDMVCSKEIAKETSAFNACGQFNLLQSASILQKSALVLTPDTGLMHIAAAFNIPTISVWGNTIPEFGMTPFMNKDNYIIVENRNLSCRPCSKIGFDKCPKQHFKCMNLLEIPQTL